MGRDGPAGDLLTMTDPAAVLADRNALIGELAARRVTVEREIHNLEAERDAIDTRLAALMAEQGMAIAEGDLE